MRTTRSLAKSETFCQAGWQKENRPSPTRFRISAGVSSTPVANGVSLQNATELK